MSRELAAWADDARARTLSLVGDLSDDELLGPRLDIVNPLRWELGHLAWFQEKWILRHFLGKPALLARGDALYDSAAVAHDSRWDLPLLTRGETLDYMGRVHDAAREAMASHADDPMLAYFARLAIFHEDMHGEAFAMTRQTLGYRPPPDDTGRASVVRRGYLEMEGGEFELGSPRDAAFVFDNEKWAHRVRLAPFRIAESPVTQGDFAAFADDGGYARDSLWTESGRAWREASAAAHPVYWRKQGTRWSRRHFDRWIPLEPDLPVMGVCFHEAEAYARWAKARLPTEAEWEFTALRVPALLFSGVWEWTASDFAPYPGFSPDPYREYSEPWFHTHKVLRGASWVTQSRLARAKFRNFYEAHRRDVFAGFRVCRRLE